MTIARALALPVWASSAAPPPSRKLTTCQLVLPLSTIASEQGPALGSAIHAAAAAGAYPSVHEAGEAMGRVERGKYQPNPEAADAYDALFAEKLDLLLRIREAPQVTWSGRHRPALTGQGVYPRPLQDPLPVWVGVGGTPASFVRAGPGRWRSGPSRRC